MDGYISERTNDIYIYDRNKAELTGIDDVLEFSENYITLSCKTGVMSIEGHELKIGSFDSGNGKLLISGSIDCVIYFDEPESGKRSKRRRG